MTTKICTRCGEVKSFSQFHKRSEGVNKYASHCKECRNNERKKKYDENPEKYRQRWRARAAKKRLRPEYLEKRKHYSLEHKMQIANKKRIHFQLNAACYQEWYRNYKGNLDGTYIKSLIKDGLINKVVFRYLKVCSKCFDQFDFKEFNRDAWNKDGYTHQCKHCVAGRRKAQWWRDREKRLLAKKINRSNCSDSYIRELVVKRKRAAINHIPQSLINLYRENLRITRFIKGLENENC